MSMATCVQKGPWLVGTFLWLTGGFYLEEWATFHICLSGVSIGVGTTRWNWQNIVLWQLGMAQASVHLVSFDLKPRFVSTCAAELPMNWQSPVQCARWLGTAKGQISRNECTWIHSCALIKHFKAHLYSLWGFLYMIFLMKMGADFTVTLICSGLRDSSVQGGHLPAWKSVLTQKPV